MRTWVSVVSRDRCRRRVSHARFQHASTQTGCGTTANGPHISFTESGDESLRSRLMAPIASRTVPRELYSTGPFRRAPVPSRFVQQLPGLTCGRTSRRDADAERATPQRAALSWRGTAPAPGRPLRSAIPAHPGGSRGWGRPRVAHARHRVAGSLTRGRLRGRGGRSSRGRARRPNCPA